MRLAMAAMALLVMGLSFIGWRGLDRIQVAQLSLTEEAVPTLFRAQAFEQSLLKLEQSVGDLVAAATWEQREAAVGRYDRLMRETSAAGGGGGNYARLFRDLRGLHADAAALSEDIIRDQARFAEAVDHALRKADAVRAGVDAVSFEASARIETLLLEGDAPDARRQMAAVLAMLTELSSMSGLAERVGDAIAAAESAGERLRVEELEGRLAFYLRSLVRHLAQLPAITQKGAFAQDIADLRQAVLAEGGVIRLRLRLIDQTARLRSAAAAHNEAALEVSGMLGADLERTRARLLKTSDNITLTSESAVVAMQAAGALSLLLLAATAYFVVERQIIRRLARLSLAVRAIAGGANKAVVEVSGDDELGDMARALEIFRSNALELERSNRELARFAYAASHDLRSPLRAIRDLAQWTIEDGGDDLPADCRANLDLLMQRADRLSQLLDGLLDYSRVGRERSSIARVDITEIVGEACALLGKCNDFAVDYSGDAYMVTTYEAPLRQIMLNLVANAIKHHDRDAGVLQITCAVQQNRLYVSLTDDGPGIDPRYHDRIFGLFETLRSRDDVEGSGMGLAIIRKLVEHYGGEISVRSDPAIGRGATFSFDWPLKTLANDNRMAA